MKYRCPNCGGRRDSDYDMSRQFHGFGHGFGHHGFGHHGFFPGFGHGFGHHGFFPGFGFGFPFFFNDWDEDWD